MLRILIREGERPQVSGFFFKSVFQSVLLFGAETWVVTPPHRPGPGGVPGPCGEGTDGEDPTEESRRKVGVHLIGGGNRRGGV